MRTREKTFLKTIRKCQNYPNFNIKTLLKTNFKNSKIYAKVAYIAHKNKRHNNT
jgi:hypothetical protein